MGALPPISPWIPEDDLLLKNAVEAGGSLESLAKGAVRFSQRFTIREIQERWHSLLYDPNISIESAENMIELERFPLNKSSKVETSKGKGEGPKRKVKSVRSYYYAFHKRIRSDPLNQDNLDSVVPPVEDPVGSYLEIENAGFVYPENIAHDTAVGLFEDNVDDSDANKNGNINMYPCLEDNLDSSFHHLQCSSPSEMHLWRNQDMEDSFRLPNEVRKSSSEYESQIACDDVNASSSGAQYDLSAFDTLLNLSDDDDGMISIDDDVKVFEKYGLSNLLLDFPSDMIHKDQILDVTEADCTGQEEPKLSSAIDTNSQIGELCNEVYNCALNTEDLEVPNNDYVIFPTKKNRRGESSFKGNLHNNTLVNRELKIFGELHTQMGKDDANFLISKSANCNTNSKHHGIASRSAAVIKMVAKQTNSDIPDFHVKEKKEKESVNVFEVNNQSENVDEMALEAALETLLSDGEEEPSADDDYDDDDIPCVSDVELVIHDMDLDLGSGDLNSYSSRTVAKYQTDDAKREIIRSEQSWNASRHRAIASNGAFAYLFGCNRKTYYIKKPEVLLGRATSDFSVDIDLGKERRANKISRRQAFIKIDENGEFHLRNLGKCPIEVNGKELYPGQSLILESNSHIKVRGMDFTFEKNQACVKQYLDAISRTTPPN